MHTMKNPNMARKGKRNGMYGTKGWKPWRNTSGFIKGIRKGVVLSEGIKKKMSDSKLKDNPSHTALHKWVRRWKGKANKCSECGLSDINRRYEWANISGKYLRDLEDYREMCVPCHRKFDGNNKLYLHSSKYLNNN